MWKFLDLPYFWHLYLHISVVCLHVPHIFSLKLKSQLFPFPKKAFVFVREPVLSQSFRFYGLDEVKVPEAACPSARVQPQPEARAPAWLRRRSSALCQLELAAGALPAGHGGPGRDTSGRLSGLWRAAAWRRRYRTLYQQPPADGTERWGHGRSVEKRL